MERGLVSIVGPHIWGYDDETPEEAAGLLLAQKKLTLATMESCTGGLLASTITDAAGSASYFKGGVVVYSEASAIAGGVPPDTIKSHGMISEEAAAAMAQAAKERFGADIGIGLTGIAGPEEIEGKPVGLVHISISIALPHPFEATPKHFPSRWPPRRTVVKQRAASTAMIELRRLLNTL